MQRSQLFFYCCGYLIQMLGRYQEREVNSQVYLITPLPVAHDRAHGFYHYSVMRKSPVWNAVRFGANLQGIPGRARVVAAGQVHLLDFAG